MPEQSAGESARRTAAEQAIILAFSVAGLAIMLWIQRAGSDPDFARTMRMRSAKHAEKYYARVAAEAWKRAEAARLLYESERA
jgi:hypothetical protein